MLKRTFWLALLVLGGWLLWSLWRQRQEAYHAPSPQFAPIPPAPSTAPVASAQPIAAPVPTPPSTTARPDINGADAPTDMPVEPSADGAVASTPADASEPIIGYCTRCQEKRQIHDAQEELTESGRRAARGTCPVCGGNMYTFLKKKPDGE
jgi:hypothetical protein